VTCCIVLYYLGNSAYSSKGSISLTFCIFLGLIVTVLWLCAMMNDLVLPWPTAQRDVFKSLSIFTLNPEALGLECSLGAQPLMLYAFRCSGPLMVIVVVMLCYYISKLAALANKRELAWELDKSINTIGTIFQALFILIVVIAVDPFNRFTHPNGMQSMLSAPTVMYGESEWTPFALLGISVFVIFVVPFFTLTVLGTIKAPSLATKPWFTKRFRFSLYRFRPDCWWWGVLLNVRQILLAFASSLPSEDPHVQSTYLVCILGVYLILVARYWPWKNHELNVAEVSLFTLVMLMIKSCTAFMDASPRPDGHAAAVMTFMVAIGGEIFIYFALFGWALFQKRDLMAEFTFRSGPSIQDVAVEQFWQLCQSCTNLGEQETRQILKSMNGYDIRSVLFVTSAFHASAPLIFQKRSSGSSLTDLSYARMATPEVERTPSARSSESGRESASTVPTTGEPPEVAKQSMGEFEQEENPCVHTQA
jgi:hypothetical protein